MDIDATTLQNALDVLQKRFGAQSGGGHGVTEAEISQVLQEQMHVDELTADRVITKLYETGQLATPGKARTKHDQDTDSASGGILIAMPGSEVVLAESELLTMTLPGLLPGTPSNPAGGVTAGFPIGAKAAEVTITGDPSQGPVREADLENEAVERREEDQEV